MWKDARIQTGFGWHWDHTYWGGAPKTSTWIALDDADVDNGCLMLVPGSHRIIPQLQARFTQKFRPLYLPCISHASPLYLQARFTQKFRRDRQDEVDT